MNEAILQEKIDEITKRLSIANDILLKVHTNDTQLDRVAFCICSSLADLDELKAELEESRKAQASKDKSEALLAFYDSMQRMFWQ